MSEKDCEDTLDASGFYQKMMKDLAEPKDLIINEGDIISMKSHLNDSQSADDLMNLDFGGHESKIGAEGEELEDFEDEI